MQDQTKVPQKYLDLINQVFEIEKKALAMQEQNSISRNINKIKEMIEHEFFSPETSQQSVGFIYHNPVGESYNETRTDCEASISGTSTDNLEIIEVIKPIIFLKQGGIKRMVQKAVIVAQSKNLTPNT
ncbi:MAG: hypothetical protein WBO28_02375 [Flavobacteriales bacterium]